MHRRTALSTLGCFIAWPLSSTAQTAYPTKTIRIYVPFSAGSGSDSRAEAAA